MIRLPTGSLLLVVCLSIQSLILDVLLRVFCMLLLARGCAVWDVYGSSSSFSPVTHHNKLRSHTSFVAILYSTVWKTWCVCDWLATREVLFGGEMTSAWMTHGNMTGVSECVDGRWWDSICMWLTAAEIMCVRVVRWRVWLASGEIVYECEELFTMISRSIFTLDLSMHKTHRCIKQAFWA